LEFLSVSFQFSRAHNTMPSALGVLSFALGLQSTLSARVKHKQNMTEQVEVESPRCPVDTFCSCTLGRSESERERPLRIWSAQDVQFEILAFARGPDALCKPHSSYAVAYAAMTVKRDSERCNSSSPMYPPTRIAEIANNALADLMSRYYVAAESSRAPLADLEALWSNLRDDAERRDYNTLHYAMASTALYLTSHMGLALSALPHAEELWEGTGLTTVEQRVNALTRDYKPSYDAFNPFLADNVNTIADALWDAGLLSQRGVNIAAKLVWSGGTTALFNHIRTKTFELGMQAAQEIQVGTHPLTQRFYGRIVLATDYDLDGFTAARDSEALKELVKHAQYWRRWMGDGLGPVWQSLGGLRYRDLREGSRWHTRCMEAAGLR